MPKANPNHKLKLTGPFLKKVQPELRDVIFWDTIQPGMCVKVTPKSKRSFKAVYRHGGRLRWFHIDTYPAIGLADARRIARTVRARAALGEDPHGEKVELRRAGKIEGRTFDDIAQACAPFWRTTKLPNADSWTVSPPISASKISSRTETTNSADSLRETPTSRYTASLKSARVTVPAAMKLSHRRRSIGNVLHRSAHSNGGLGWHFSVTNLPLMELRDPLTFRSLTSLGSEHPIIATVVAAMSSSRKNWKILAPSVKFRREFFGLEKANKGGTHVCEHPTVCRSSGIRGENR